MNALDIKQILDRLPHRFPFLLVDRVLELEPGRRIVALKNVTINEPFFPGHFPHFPVMPGVLIVEAMAQAAGILGLVTSDSVNQAKDTVIYLAGIDEARFRRPVVPGDQLTLSATVERAIRGIQRYSARAHVGEELVAEARMMSAVRPL
ncbi:MAG: 3-hydroxyacyl-ACP dehydratase FabZ [Burkholderiales bacterium]|nr:3-hydroxyacyl-ACP dehydratase FabZ [Burkholderiales bacterium]